MKCLLLAFSLPLGLAACASAPPAENRFTPDQEKMAIVERAASRQGVSVVWINAPKKVVPASGH